MSVKMKKISLKALDEMQKALLKANEKIQSEDEGLAEEAQLSLDDLREVCQSLEADSENDLPLTSCDGEMFCNIFDFLESEVCEELRLGGKYEHLLNFWQEDSDASELIILTPEIIKSLRACFSSIDLDIPLLIEDLAEEFESEEIRVSSTLQSLISSLISANGEALLFVAD